MNGVFWGLGAALVWGTGDFTARFTSRSIGPARSLFGALAAGALALTLFIPWIHESLMPSPQALAFSVLGGVLNMAGLLLLYAALARGPVTVVAPIIASHPALVVLLLLFFGVRPEPIQWAGMGVTMGGLLLLTHDVGQEGRFPEFDRQHVQRTVFLSIIATLLFGVQIVAMQEARAVYGAFATSWLTRWISLAALLVWAGFRRTNLLFPWRRVPLVTAQGWMDAGGNLFMLIGSLGPDRAVVTVVSSTFAAVTVLLARIFLKESISALQWFSIAVLLFGIGMLGSVG